MDTATPNDQLSRLQQVADRYRVAHEAYEAAVEARVDAVEEARQAGLSVVDIGEVLGLCPDQVTTITEVSRHWR